MAENSDWRWLSSVAKVASACLCSLFAIVLLSDFVANQQQATAQRVIVEGELQHLPKTELQAVLQTRVQGAFYRIDINDIRDTLEEISWIKRASVSRRWPKTLVIRVEERRPIARWGDLQMISDDGSVFAHENFYKGPRLTQLFASGDRADDVLTQYQMLSAHLAHHNIELTQLYLEKSGAWKALLNDDVELLLGHKDLVNRIKTLDRVLKDGINQKISEINRLDLRYDDSVAVQWKVQLEQKLAAG